jgi:acyl carrier protein
MSQAPEGLRHVIGGVLDIPPDQVTPELAAGQVETWDSFGHLPIILALEAEYGIQFPPEQIPELTSVALLASELAARGVSF